MNPQKRNGMKKAIFTLALITIGATVVAVAAISPFQSINWRLDSNIDNLTDELGACQSPARKIWIIQTLGALNASSATRVVQQCLDDQDPGVRLSAINAISKMPGLDALEVLAIAARHPDPKVREVAQWARSKRAYDISTEEILEGLSGL